ncbi:MAG TPA: hypothetical protein VGR97_11860 [Candidatus Acidoferrales bacterium]|nr:hypothetical protein [Candidatus Acidoferrales bacterium]
MTEAETLFNQTFARWLRVGAMITNFRNTFTAVATSTSTHLEKQAAELFRSLHEEPQWKGLLVDIKTEEPATAKSPSAYQKLGKVGAKVIFDSSYASLDAAVLVFYHSLLDGMALDCCRITALHAPQDWEQDLKNSQVSLLESKSKSYDELLRAKIEERLERLERESLLTKLDRLFARCNPSANWSPMAGYEFVRKDIELFDDQRHEIVHGEALGKTLTLFEVSEENLFYVQQTGMYLLGLVNHKYGLKVDPRFLQPQRPQPSPDATHRG